MGDLLPCSPAAQLPAPQRDSLHQINLLGQIMAVKADVNE